MRELALHILDVLQNAIEAGATRITLTIEEDQAGNRLAFTVRDNGRGMPPDLAARVLDPFVTTRQTRRVGLGLPLLAAAAERAGGGVQVRSREGQGTEVSATFQLRHWDRAPLGDLPGTLLAVLLGREAVHLTYEHRVDGREFRLDTDELRQALGEVPFTHPSVRAWLREYLEEAIAGLQRPAE
ncbi:MAG: ATP-binding protein [Anaerolineae bacterium]|nr:ATP-binding protein [Anaerolineae bacterium]